MGKEPSRSGPAGLKKCTAVMFLSTIAGLLVLGACTDKLPTPPPPTPATPTVPDSIQTIFDASCLSGCHNGGSPAANLDLSTAEISYASLINIPSASCSPLMQVRPFKPDSSCIILRMTGATPPSMPPLGTLPAPEINAVNSWILQGAPSGTQ